MPSRVPKLKAGDLIAFSGNTLISDTINVLSLGIPRYSISHIGVIASRCRPADPDTDELVLYEALMKVPKRRCLIQLKKTAGVQAQLIAPYLREDHGKIWLYPLSRRLFPHEEAAMWRFLQAQIGKNYDLHGAIRAGGWVYALLNGLFRNGGRSRLNELFCSELGAGSHNTSGLYLTGNASRWSPNKYCRRTRLAGVFQRPYRIDGCLTCDQSLPSCCR